MDSSSKTTQQPNLIPSKGTSLTSSHSAQPATTNTALSSYSLVGLAGKLFSILTELKKSTQAHEADTLSPYLSKELKHFAEQAASQGHTEETILVAQFALARSLDEVIASQEWGQTSTWQAQRLVSSLPHAETLAANFTDALKKMSEVPEIFVDVLELIYICQNLSDSNKQHDSLNQELYMVIQQQRGEFERRLSKKRPQQSTVTTKPIPKRYLSLLAIGIVLLLIALYISFNYLLDESSNELNAQLNTSTLTAASNTNDSR